MFAFAVELADQTAASKAACLATLLAGRQLSSKQREGGVHLASSRLLYEYLSAYLAVWFLDKVAQ